MAREDLNDDIPGRAVAAVRDQAPGNMGLQPFCGCLAPSRISPASRTRPIVASDLTDRHPPRRAARAEQRRRSTLGQGRPWGGSSGVRSRVPARRPVWHSTADPADRTGSRAEASPHPPIFALRDRHFHSLQLCPQRLPIPSPVSTETERLAEARRRMAGGSATEGYNRACGVKCSARKLLYRDENLTVTSDKTTKHHHYKISSKSHGYIKATVLETFKVYKIMKRECIIWSTLSYNPPEISNSLRSSLMHPCFVMEEAIDPSLGDGVVAVNK